MEFSGMRDAQRLPWRPQFGYRIGVHTAESGIFTGLAPNVRLQPLPPGILAEGPVLRAGILVSLR